MPRTATPDPIGDHIDEAAAGLFGSLEEKQRIKCRYVYASAKIEAIQGKGEEPSASLVERHDELEAELKERGIEPSSVMYRLNN